MLPRTFSDESTTSNPFTDALPELGSRREESILIVVVLPAPLGPSSPKISPRGILRLRLSTATMVFFSFLRVSLFRSPPLLLFRHLECLSQIKGLNGIGIHSLNLPPLRFSHHSHENDERAYL